MIRGYFPLIITTVSCIFITIMGKLCYIKYFGGLSMNKRTLGSKGEIIAKEFLQKQGYKIKEENFWSRYGEIDIIAEDDDYLVFVEVKFSHQTSYVRPQEQITYYKQQHLKRVANYYLVTQQIEKDCRFDVVAILQNEEQQEIELIRNAFLV